MAKVKGAIIPWNIQTLKVPGVQSAEITIGQQETAPALFTLYVSIKNGTVKEIETGATPAPTPEVLTETDNRLAGAFIPFKESESGIKIDDITVKAYWVGDVLELKIEGPITDGSKTPWTSGVD